VASQPGKTAAVPLRRRGLGMGLSALLGEPAGTPRGDGGGLAEGVPAAFEGPGVLPPRRLPVELLRPSPFQPRRAFAEGELEDLAASMREHGVLQPLLVRPAPGGVGGYEIVAGERRWRAAQRAGLHEVPVLVRELGDRAALEVALVENVQRADLSPLEEAEGFRRLIDEFGHTQEALAAALGKSRSHVANTLRLLGLPPPLREMLADGRLSAGHARALLGAREPERLAASVIEGGLNVRQAEELVRREAAAGPALRRPVAPPPSPDAADLARRLTARIGLEVGLRSRGAGGVMTIRWRDEEQLSHLLERLG
jgi:ParB family transcriptional regulator, chromosome partitioning protein